MILLTKGTKLSIFGEIKIPMKFSINLYFSYVCSICVFFCFHFLVVSGKGGGLFKRTKMLYISVL